MPMKRGPSKRGRKLKSPPQIPTWISESREFSMSVVEDIMMTLHTDAENMTRSERQSLVHIERMWLKIYKGRERQPESNPRPLTPPPPKKSRKRSQPKPKPEPEPKPHPEVNFLVVDVNHLPDSRVIPHRICIPRLRPHWQMTDFFVYMPAYVIKRGLLGKYMTWSVLERIMTLDKNGALVFFQAFIDFVIILNPLEVAVE